jgi:hypothetical protein
MIQRIEVEVGRGTSIKKNYSIRQKKDGPHK